MTSGKPSKSPLSVDHSHLAWLYASVRVASSIGYGAKYRGLVLQLIAEADVEREVINLYEEDAQAMSVGGYSMVARAIACMWLWSYWRAPRCRLSSCGNG